MHRLLLSSLATLALLPAAEVIPVSRLDLSLGRQDWKTPQADRSVEGKPLRIAGREFRHGVGAHSMGELAIDLRGEAQRFTAWVGLNDAASSAGSVTFTVSVDGKVLWTSPVMTKGQQAARCEVDLTGGRTLLLEVTGGPDGYSNDHGDWAEAEITTNGTAPVTIPVATVPRTQVVSGAVWRDTAGVPIQAHGGGLLRHDGVWYWYGEDKSAPTSQIPHARTDVVGIACYRSTDLVAWERIGVVLPAVPQDPAHDLHPSKVAERPKVLYNATTKKFVMWLHADCVHYRQATAGVATADQPTGPFTYHGSRRPINDQTFRDMNLLQDEDGQAYVFYSSEDNATQYVSRLAPDYLDVVRPAVEGETWRRNFIGKKREAPAPFKHAGKYYQITSGCTWWYPNAAEWAVADHPLGPYEARGNPCTDANAERTYGGQGTFVQSLGNGRFLFMLDRWNPDNLGDSRYVWLPFTIGADGAVKVPWTDRWGSEVLTPR